MKGLRNCENQRVLTFTNLEVGMGGDRLRIMVVQPGVGHVCGL